MAGRRAAQTTISMIESHHGARKETRSSEARDFEDDDRVQDRCR